jgi:uncharacterized membrane protein HdeD (DUF308 family)
MEGGEMQRNESNADRIIRIILGIVLAGLGIYFQGSWGIVAMIVLVILGLILLITGITGFCGLYKILKISTYKKK